MANVQSLWITQWGQEFAFKYQQKESRLRQSVWVVNAEAGSFSFPRMESSNAILDKGRHATLTPANVDMDRIAVTPHTIHWSEPLDSFDTLRTNADLRSALTTVGVASINRQIDALIIAALNTSTNAVTLPTANTLNSAGLLLVAQNQNNADVDFEDRHAAISAGAINNIQSDVKFTSRDYVAGQLLQTGNVPNCLGYNMSFTNLLPVPSAGLKRNFFYHRMAVGVQVLQDLTMRVDYRADIDAMQVMVKAAVGAVLIRPEAVFYADVTG